MIIKSKPIKSKIGMERTLRYILSEKKKSQEKGFVLTRFISGDRNYGTQLEEIKGDCEKESIVLENRISNMMLQFEQNNGTRLIKRTNGNRAYHEIISFHKKDTQAISEQVLLKIARRYVKKRSPNSLIVATMHDDKEHLHIHCVIGSVEFETGKTLHLTRKEFKEVKVDMEQWQEKSLGLEHSKVNHSKKKKSRF